MLDLIILTAEFDLNGVFDVCIFFFFIFNGVTVGIMKLQFKRLPLFDVIGSYVMFVELVLYLNFWSNKEIVAESWVEVSDLPISPAPFDRGQAAQGPDDYLRLLREAQRESNQSSALVSLASTRKNSPHSSWVELFI